MRRASRDFIPYPKLKERRAVNRLIVSIRKLWETYSILPSLSSSRYQPSKKTSFRSLIVSIKIHWPLFCAGLHLASLSVILNRLSDWECLPSYWCVETVINSSIEEMLSSAILPKVSNSLTRLVMSLLVSIELLISESTFLCLSLTLSFYSICLICLITSGSKSSNCFLSDVNLSIDFCMSSKALIHFFCAIAIWIRL